MKVCLLYIVGDTQGMWGKGGLMPGVLCSSLTVATWCIHLGRPVAVAGVGIPSKSQNWIVVETKTSG